MPTSERKYEMKSSQKIQDLIEEYVKSEGTEDTIKMLERKISFLRNVAPQIKKPKPSKALRPVTSKDP